MARCFAALTLLLGLLAVPAAAHAAGLIQPATFLKTFEDTCEKLDADAIARVADDQNWHPISPTKSADKTSWHVPFEGGAVTLTLGDIKGHPTCAISAASDPATIIALLTDKLGQRDEPITTGHAQFGNLIAFTYTKQWTVKTDAEPRIYRYTTTSGSRDVRLEIISAQ